jgi:branched-chain amino acid aminotransferase
MSYINFNGKLLPAGTAIVTADNRGLRYGDGLFETILYKRNKFILPDAHLERLWNGMQLMQFDLPKLFTKEFILKELQALVHKNSHTHARVRLEIIRGNGGLYDAENMQPHYIIQSRQLEEEAGMLNSNGLQVCIYKDAVKTCDTFSNLKHNNFLPYYMGALFAKTQRCNDAILLNQYGNICDSTIANVFIIKENIIYTPALSEGCVAGTRRQFLIKELPAAGFPVEETQLNTDFLLSADEIFLSNAIHPVKWIANIADASFSNQNILRINDMLRRTFPDIFC